MPAGRVLMIAHHFAPMGGSGSNRALAFARYLAEYAWQPIVLTPAAAWASNRDDQLLAELPPHVQVIRTRSFEPRIPGRGSDASDSVGGKLAWNHTPPPPRQGPGPGGWGAPRALRSHVGHLKRFPDAHIGWLPFALVAARRLDYDVAYSSSGPFTSHLVGLLLKRFTGRPWVAELRDGWYRWNRAIFPDYPVWRDVLERCLEAAVIRSADRVVLVTDRMANAFRHQYPALPADHFAVVSNGFDPAQFQILPQSHVAENDKTFEVLHAGALYYGRSLSNFLEAAARLIDADPAFGRSVRLTLLGTLDGTAQAELARHPLGGRIHFAGQLDHAATIAAMRAASLLLLISNTTPGAEATVPGKLFEYLAVGRPILAIAPPDSSTADVLALTGAGSLAASDDPSAITCALRQAFSAHTANPVRTPNPQAVAGFDRRVLAGDLARIFDQVGASAARRA